MSVYPNQTFLNPSLSFYAGAYTASGGVSSNTPFPAVDLPIANGASCNIYTFKSDLMPDVGKSYLVSVSAGLSAMTGAGTGANAYVNVGLQYDSAITLNSLSGTSMVNPGSSIGLINMTDIFTKKANPSTPLRIILGNNTGGTITAGGVRITAVNVIEVPSPKNLVDADIVP